MNYNPYSPSQASTFAQPIQQDTKHSGFGIASFILSIVSGIGIFAVIIVAGLLELNTPGGIDEDSVTTAIIGLGILAFLFGEVLAMVFGAIGLFQPNCKKLFAILGIIFSLMATVMFIALMVIGSVAP